MDVIMNLTGLSSTYKKRESLSSVSHWGSYRIYMNFNPGVGKTIPQSEFSWDWQERIK